MHSACIKGLRTMPDNLTREQRSYSHVPRQGEGYGIGDACAFGRSSGFGNTKSSRFRDQYQVHNLCSKWGSTASMGPSHLSNGRQKNAVNFDLDRVELKK